MLEISSDFNKSGIHSNNDKRIDLNYFGYHNLDLKNKLADADYSDFKNSPYSHYSISKKLKEVLRKENRLSDLPVYDFEKDSTFKWFEAVKDIPPSSIGKWTVAHTDLDSLFSVQMARHINVRKNLKGSKKNPRLGKDRVLVKGDPDENFKNFCGNRLKSNLNENKWKRHLHGARSTKMDLVVMSFKEDIDTKEIDYMIKTLSEGGNFVMEIPDTHSYSTIDIIHFMKTCFDKVYVISPKAGDLSKIQRIVKAVGFIPEKYKPEILLSTDDSDPETGIKDSFSDFNKKTIQNRIEQVYSIFKKDPHYEQNLQDWFTLLKL